MKVTEENVQEWLQENAPHIKLIEWRGRTSIKSKFIDLNRNIEFLISFTTLKYKLAKNPNYFFALTTKELAEKRKKTMLEKYGVEHQSRLKWVQDKIKQTSLERYGVEHALSSDFVKKKREQTNLEKYGVKNCFCSEEKKDKIKQTNLEKYGAENPQQVLSIKKKTQETNLKKYGFKSPSKNKKIKEKISKVKTKHFFGSKTLKEISIEKNVSYGHALRKKKAGVESLEDFNKKNSILEVKIKNILNIDFEEGKFIKPYFADFCINNNLIIECDGLYWHSDTVKKGKDYHKIKKDFYLENGYDSLFFRADEIKEKIDIVQSIINNKLKKSYRIFGRKCKLIKLDKKETKSFLNENHLMGNGAGNSFGLVHDNILIAVIQYKWKNKKEKTIEISRFCPKINYSVIGGLGKLISEIIKIEQPNKVISFVDRRYGNGEGLKKLGFTKINESLSFKWTDYQKTYGRMQFPGNSGYEHGLAKIWDCGQAKWEKQI